MAQNDWLRERSLEIAKRMSVEEVADELFNGWRKDEDYNDFLTVIAEKIRDSHPVLSEEISDFICSWGGGA